MAARARHALSRACWDHMTNDKHGGLAHVRSFYDSTLKTVRQWTQAQIIIILLRRIYFNHKMDFFMHAEQNFILEG
jgi:hypothetical protein